VREHSQLCSRIIHSNSIFNKSENFMKCLLPLLLVSVLTFVHAATAQSTQPAPTVLPLDKIQNQQQLDQTITALDAALFDAYNKCDLVKFASFIDDHVEFYHDQGGVTLGQAALTESVKKNICGTTTRELVPGSLHIYYMKGYGAVEIGVHRFHHPGHEDTIGVGEGQFIHLWQCKDGAWKITRVISYDHHAAAK
jgi:hypothetical protein